MIWLLKVLADLHSAAELKEAAVKFVVEHSEEFVDQVEIAQFWRKNYDTIFPNLGGQVQTVSGPDGRAFQGHGKEPTY